MKPISKSLFVGSVAFGWLLADLLIIAASLNPRGFGQFGAQEIIVLALIPLLYAGVMFAILVYKMWAPLQDGYARTTPGKAVGFLLIPFFNFYWAFQAIWGFAKDYNRYIDRHLLFQVARLPEGLFLANVILTLTGWIPSIGIYLTTMNHVLGIFMVALTCDAINAVAAAWEERRLSRAAPDMPASAPSADAPPPAEQEASLPALAAAPTMSEIERVFGGSAIQNPARRQQGLDMLVQMHAAQGDELLVSLLQNQRRELRWASAKMIGRIGSAQAMPALDLAMGDTSALVRIAAAEAADRLGARMAMPVAESVRKPGMPRWLANTLFSIGGVLVLGGMMLCAMAMIAANNRRSAGPGVFIAVSTPVLAGLSQPTRAPAQLIDTKATPAIEPTATSDLKAVTGERWQITLDGASQEQHLTSVFRKEFTPDPGYRFVVVRVTFKNLAGRPTLDSSQSEYGMINGIRFYTDLKTAPPAAMALRDITLSGKNGKPFPLIGFDAGVSGISTDNFVLGVTNLNDLALLSPLEATPYAFVFSVPADQAGQQLEWQYKGDTAAPIPVSAESHS